MEVAVNHIGQDCCRDADEGLARNSALGDLLSGEVCFGLHTVRKELLLVVQSNFGLTLKFVEDISGRVSLPLFF